MFTKKKIENITSSRFIKYNKMLNVMFKMKANHTSPKTSLHPRHSHPSNQHIIQFAPRLYLSLPQCHRHILS